MKIVKRLILLLAVFSLVVTSGCLSVGNLKGPEMVEGKLVSITGSERYIVIQLDKYIILAMGRTTGIMEIGRHYRVTMNKNGHIQSIEAR